MNRREKVLAGVLGGLIVAFVGGLGGYFGFYQPAQVRYANAARIEAETAEKAKKLDALVKNRARLADATRKSLPADPDVARREYEAALGRLLAAAKVPRGYTLRPKSPDSRPVPELGPKKPAYQRVAFELTLKKVDLGTLVDFLERYYRLNILHQITRLQIKRAEVEGTAAGRRGSTADRADLDVTIVTEAAILDGAENRKVLLPVPLAAGAALGSTGLFHLTQTPELGRGLAPPAADPAITGTREYLAILAKDPFHGPLPPVVAPAASVDSVKVSNPDETPAAKFTVKLSAAFGKPVTVAYGTKDDSAVADRDYKPTAGVLTFAPGETTKAVLVPLLGGELASDRTFALALSNPTGGAVLGASAKGTATLVAPPPAPPKEDVSAFVKLTGITRRSDGTATADVKDAANNLDYQIDLKARDGAVTVKVVKYYYIKDRRKFLDSGTALDISDDTSSTARKFQVVGIDADGLVLTAAPEKPKETGKPDPRGGGRFGPRPAPVPIDPAVAVGGGAVAGVPREPVFVWRVGQPLSVVKELPAAEAPAAIARGKAWWGPSPEAAKAVEPTESPRPASGLRVE